jgi:putative ABC transport system permease protein
MHLLLQFSRRFLFRHPGQLLLALTGIAAGVAVVTGVALMRDVLLTSLDSATDALTGTDSLRIEHRGGVLDEQVYVGLATTRGAPALVPVLRTRVRYNDQTLELLALDPLSLADGGPLRLSGGATTTLLQSGNTVMTSARTMARLGLNPGQNFAVVSGGQPLNLELVNPPGPLPELDNRLVMDLANGQHLLGRVGELSWIEAPATAHAWLLDHLPDGFELSDPGQRRASAASLTAGMRANITAMSLLALVVGLFVVYSVLAFLLVQRKRQIGMLRAVGVTPHQLAGWLLSETLALAGLGSLAGLVLGTWLAGLLLDLIRAPLAELYGLVPAATITPTAALYLIVWLISVVLSLVATSSILQHAVRIPPGQLSRQFDADHRGARRGLFGAVAGLVVAGLAVLAFLPELAWALVGLFLLLSASALLAPAAGMQILTLLHRVGGRSLIGRALGMLGTSRQRLGPSLAALSLALALTAGLAMMVLGFRAAVDDWVDRLLRADVYLTVSGGRIGPDLIETVSAWPEIAQLSSARRHQLPDGTNLIAYDLNERAWQGFDWIASGQSSAYSQFMSGRGVLISEPLARRMALHTGEALELPVRGEMISLEILGIYRDYASDRGTIAIVGQRYRQLFDDPIRDSLGLYLVNPGRDRSALDAHLDSLPDAINLTDREQVRDQTMAIFDRTFRISWALAGLVGVIAIIALVSALLALGLERAREYATLRALGLSRGGLARWIIAQTTGLAAAATVLAIPISLLIHLVLSLAIQPRAFGWSISLTLPWQPWLAIVPLALLTGFLAGIYPAWKIARRNPAPLLKGS